MEEQKPVKEKKHILLKVIIVMLIIIILFLIGLGIFGYIMIKPFLGDSGLVGVAESLFSGDSQEVSSGYDHPLLSDSQEQVLEKVGIDVEKIPTEITPAMEDCFVQALGAERVAEIKSGQAEPGLMDVLKAKSCVEQ